MIDLQTKLAGEYRLVINRADGNVEDTGWFDNLILNQGLDLLGNSGGQGIVRYAQVGTGTSTPVVTQTALDARVAGAESSPAGAQAVTATNEGAPLYRTLMTYAYPFAQGSVVGNITEVGVGTTAATGGLFSRARIVDNLGAPTSITIVALDQLTVYYRVRMIPPLADATGSVSISSTNYNYTMRVANVASFMNVQFLLNSSLNFSQAQNSGHVAYPAGSVLGPITGVPTGTPGVDGTAVTSSYTTGTYYRDATFNWSITQGNVVGGIQCIRFIWPQTYSAMQFQVRFDTPIPKTNTNVLSLNVRYSWARA
jgi:hypothetical protein